MRQMIIAKAPITKGRNKVARAAQIPLSFPIKDSYDAHDFMPLPCNQSALDWIERFPDWPYPALIMYGEQGCGKTHLLNIWATKAGTKGQAIDDIDQFFGNKDAEENLFHLFNQARENNTYLLFSMKNSVAQQKILLPDLASRLRAAPQVEIQSPDDMALQGILVKLFHDRQLKVEPEVIAYILPRIERSFDAARTLVAQLDSNAMAEKRAVTVPLVRDVLVEPVLDFGD